MIVNDLRSHLSSLKSIFRIDEQLSMQQSIKDFPEDFDSSSLLATITPYTSKLKLHFCSVHHASQPAFSLKNASAFYNFYCSKNFHCSPHAHRFADVTHVEPRLSNILLNCRFSTDDTSCTVKLEFTCLLLVVSTCFIALNLPYFVVWCMRVYNQLSAGTAGPASSSHLRGTLYISKTIFSFNYCINFFLYSMTGVNFRRQLKILFSRNRNKGKAASKTQYSQISITNTSATPRPSITHSGVSSV